jgi:hypothetical protein
LTFKHIPLTKLSELSELLERYLALRERQVASQKLREVRAEIEMAELELAEIKGQLTVQDELVRQLQATVDLNSPLEKLAVGDSVLPAQVEAKVIAVNGTLSQSSEMVQDEAAP